MMRDMRQKGNLLSFGVVAILSLLLASTAWGAPEGASANTAPSLHIGAISNLTGEGAAWGINHQRGTILAAEQRNAAGGVKGRQVKIVFEDSPGGLARSAISAYRKLVDLEGVRIILGPLMGDELLAIAPLSRRDEVFLVGATYMPALPDNFFSTWINAEKESALIAERMRSSFQRIAILGSQQSWESVIARHVRDAFVAQGGEVVGFEEPSFDATDVATEVLRTSRSSPEAIFISSYFLLPRYSKEMKRLGISVPLFSIELDQSVIDDCQGRVEGLRSLGPTPPTPEFTRTFKGRWGEQPDLPAAHSYDAANVLFEALQNTDQSYAALREYFAKLSEYHGVTGVISNAPESTRNRTAWYQVRSGTLKPE